MRYLGCLLAMASISAVGCKKQVKPVVSDAHPATAGDCFKSGDGNTIVCPTSDMLPGFTGFTGARSDHVVEPTNKDEYIAAWKAAHRSKPRHRSRLIGYRFDSSAKCIVYEGECYYDQTERPASNGVIGQVVPQTLLRAEPPKPHVEIEVWHPHPVGSAKPVDPSDDDHPFVINGTMLVPELLDKKDGLHDGIIQTIEPLPKLCGPKGDQQCMAVSPTADPKPFTVIEPVTQPVLHCPDGFRVEVWHQQEWDFRGIGGIITGPNPSSGYELYVKPEIVLIGPDSKEHPAKCVRDK